MILDGRSVVDKKLVTLGDPEIINTDDQVQPNGVDLRIDKLYEVQGSVRIPTNGKAKADLSISLMEPKDGYWQLSPRQQIYYVDFLEFADISDGFCAQLITRSSLVRSGVDVMSGLWDTGWKGRLGCTLRVHSPISIQWGAKLCQILVFNSKFNGHRYDGRYQGTNSQSAITQSINEH